MITPPTHITLEPEPRRVPIIIRMDHATMEEAIEWMNAPTDVLSRFERKHALLTYINTRIELAAIKETKVPEGG